MCAMKKILTVSVLAMAAVGAANATIVSETMLSATKGKYSSQNTVENAITAAETAAKNASVPLAQGDGNANKIMVTNSSGQVTPVATISADKITGLSTALSDKVPVAQGNDTAHQNKAMITDGSGNVTVGTIATGMITDNAVTEGKLGANAVTSAKIANGTIVNEDIADATIAKAKLDSSVQTSLGKADTALQAVLGNQIGAAKVGTAESADKGQTLVVDENGQVSLGAVMVVKDEYDAEAVEDGDDLYPSLATTGLMIDNAMSVTKTNVSNLQDTAVRHTKNQAVGDSGTPVYVAANGQATAVNVSSAAAASTSGTSLMNEGAVYKTIDALDVSAIGGGGASGIIKQVSEANGKISATAAQIVDADVSSTAEIADSKIKLGTVSLPQSATTIATGDALNTALGKLQKQITVNATTAAGNVTDTYSATGATPVSGKAVNEALGTLDVSSAGGNGNVIVSISETDGKISATPGKISNAEVADNAAIASSKIADLASAISATAGNTVGQFVLTAKIDKTKTPTEVSYQWEDIGGR